MLPWPGGAGMAPCFLLMVDVLLADEPDTNVITRRLAVLHGPQLRCQC